MSVTPGVTRRWLKYSIMFLAAAILVGWYASTNGASARASLSRGHAVAHKKTSASKSPILIGDTCDCSGVQAASEGEWATAITVWKDWVNAHGGILGHPVQIVEKDNKTEPTAALTNTQALLANKKIVALIPGSGQGVVVSKAITAAKAPVVGGLNDDLTWGTNKYVFPVSTTAIQFAGVLAEIGVKHGANKNAADLYCAEVASCGQSLPLFEAGVKAAGGSMVYSSAISSTATSYTAPCLAAQSAGAGFIWVSEGPPQIAAVATSCAAQNYHPTYVIPNYSSSFASVPALTGTQYAFSDSLYNGGSPAAKQFQAAISKYDPGARKQAGYGEFSLTAWLSGQAIAKAIELANPKGAITRATVLKGLYMFKNQTLGGAAPALTFTKGQVPIVPCGFAYKQLSSGQLQGEGGAICAKG